MNDSNNNSDAAEVRERPVRRGSSWTIPAAIVVGFGLIALSIYFGGGRQATVVSSGTDSNKPGSLESLAPITAEDHIRGNPNAPLMIVEYSDFDCPYCKSFHVTLQKIMDEYGPSGKVAWVYRHFPLTSLHPSAAHLAAASECVAELGGNEAFWKFADLIFGERGPNDFTDLARLPEFAATAGVDKAAFQSCVDSGRHQADVEADFNNAVATGGTGTPHSIIVIGNQKLEITGGAQPYEQVKMLVDGLLK